MVGGMGPYADIDILRMIRDFMGVRRDQEHIPVMLISFPSEIVDRSAFIMEKVKENPSCGNTLCNCSLSCNFQQNSRIN